MRDILAWLDPEGKAFWRLRFGPLQLAALGAAAAALYSAREPLGRALFIMTWFDLVVHEAGHPVFGLLGSRWLGFAGGTLLQLLMPLLFYFSFLRQRQPKSADFCIFWFATNFLGIGPYMADARAQVLPLIGGGEHDWTYLLGSLGLLRCDARLGAAAVFVGCLCFALSGYSLYDHIRDSRARDEGL
ncbi:MAG: hypothetical protein NTY77_11250 [Elusimicrobia bacterium]|nr:hypothetical protein [Elusimicrobiota bacterium]